MAGLCAVLASVRAGRKRLIAKSDTGGTSRSTAIRNARRIGARAHFHDPAMIATEAARPKVWIQSALRRKAAATLETGAKVMSGKGCRPLYLLRMAEAMP